jgi:hypothetical protein
MPIRSKIAVLPAAVRNELDRRIVGRGFSGYQQLPEWLQAQGYHIAHDSVQRYGSQLRRKLRAMERRVEDAKSISAAAADETIVDATIQLIHQHVFSMLLEEPQRSERSRSADVSVCAPYLKQQGGERTAGIGLHFVPHPPPCQEMGEGRETELDADKRTWTLKKCSNEPFIDLSPSAKTGLRAAEQV